MAQRGSRSAVPLRPPYESPHAPPSVPTPSAPPLPQCGADSERPELDTVSGRACVRARVRGARPMTFPRTSPPRARRRRLGLSRAGSDSGSGRAGPGQLPVSGGWRCAGAVPVRPIEGVAVHPAPEEGLSWDPDSPRPSSLCDRERRCRALGWDREPEPEGTGLGGRGGGGSGAGWRIPSTNTRPQM